MSVTNFMQLTLPTPTVTLGPEWATELNSALETVDSHNHTSGFGALVPVAGLSIDADLDLNSFRLTTVFSSKYVNLNTPLTAALNSNSVQTVLGDLWYTNGSGTAVQITSGGSVVSVPSSSNQYETVIVNTSTTISPASTFVVLFVDTSAPRTITLPLAANVANGRIYIIKDVTGTSEAFTLTVATAGSDTLDGASTATINSNYGTLSIVGDGISAWSVY